MKPAAREQSAMTMGDCDVLCACTQPGIPVLTPSMVASLQLVGISLSIWGPMSVKTMSEGFVGKEGHFDLQ